MRRSSGATLVALLILLTLGAVPAVAFDRAANEAKILQLLNHARTRRSLVAVTVVRPLDRAALLHSRYMLSRDYFSHSSLAGAGVAARTRGAGYSVSGYGQWFVGEVIAWGTGTRGTPASVFKAWMNSSTHRQVILTARWRDVGIGCSRGTFKGRSGVVMYTVDFGRRVQ